MFRTILRCCKRNEWSNYVVYSLKTWPDNKHTGHMILLGAALGVGTMIHEIHKFEKKAKQYKIDRTWYYCQNDFLLSPFVDRFLNLVVAGTIGGFVGFLWPITTNITIGYGLYILVSKLKKVK